VNVADGIQGANQLRKEKWDNGTVTGMYANPLGNNKYQIINYIADDKGYRILSTKVVDESELAQLGGAGKFSPQTGKSAQVEINNDGETASWTVTPDQIAQQKTQPQGRSTKDKDSKDKDAKDKDAKEKDENDKDKKMQGKRSVDNNDKDQETDDEKDKDKMKKTKMHMQGKRSVDDMDQTTDDKEKEKEKDKKMKMQGRRFVDGMMEPHGGMDMNMGRMGMHGMGMHGMGKRSVDDMDETTDDKEKDKKKKMKMQGRRFVEGMMEPHGGMDMNMGRMGMHGMGMHGMGKRSVDDMDQTTDDKDKKKKMKMQGRRFVEGMMEPTPAMHHGGMDMNMGRMGMDHHVMG